MEDAGETSGGRRVVIPIPPHNAHTELNPDVRMVSLSMTRCADRSSFKRGRSLVEAETGAKAVSFPGTEERPFDLHTFAIQRRAPLPLVEGPNREVN